MIFCFGPKTHTLQAVLPRRPRRIRPVIYSNRHLDRQSILPLLQLRRSPPQPGNHPSQQPALQLQFPQLGGTWSAPAVPTLPREPAAVAGAGLCCARVPFVYWQVTGIANVLQRACRLRHISHDDSVHLSAPGTALLAAVRAFAPDLHQASPIAPVSRGLAGL